MKYLCLGYHDDQAWAALSEAKRNALLREAADYDAELRSAGHCIEAKALHDAKAAATLRFANGTFSVTDGPFAATRQQLAGVMLLEAKDLNHAIALMAQLPCMRPGGSLEIRPIDETFQLTRETTR